VFHLVNREQIGDVYGVASEEMKHFNKVIRKLKAGDSAGGSLPTPVDPYSGEARPQSVADWLY
jgi:hypothetical protein